MIRIPGSHNFKLVQKNNSGVADLSTEVKIKQRWDDIRQVQSIAIPFQYMACTILNYVN
jgi:hypothetical protein